MTVTLTFDFATADNIIQPKTFTNPLHIIEVTALNNVPSALRKVLDWTKKGYYAAGYMSYEAGAAFDAAMPTRSDVTMPYMWFGIFEEPVAATITAQQPFSLSAMQPTISEQDYAKHIEAIHNEIYEGNTYQTNYTLRLKGTFSGCAASLYTQLKEAQQANYCAYLETGTHTILSASPELFFQLHNDVITTRPMKGTIARGLTVEDDKARADWLYHSEKNRAENVMIVDLLRNDVGKIAKTGSVSVDELFTIEPYPTVHQMTSTVRAMLADDTDLYDVFAALFPCGSITGAPKVKTMHVINELEATPRDVYCGAIGYITPQQQAIFNVAIRTLVIQDGTATYGVGGGITWDSTATSEFEEVIAKAQVLKVAAPSFELLETFRLHNGIYFLYDEHIQRMANSADYFKISFPIEKIHHALQQVKQEHPLHTWRVRLVVAKNGDVTTECFAIQDEEAPMHIKLADTPIQKSERFLYHKTTYRTMYTAFQQRFLAFDDVLLWNEQGELTECTNGNIVLEIDGFYYTPPIACGLLGGTFRKALLANGEIHERLLTKEDLAQASSIWFINSVRKWRQVTLHL